MYCLALLAAVGCRGEEQQADKTAWFAGKWGVFFHYLAVPAGTTGKGTTTEEWSRQIDEFDVPGLAKQLKEVGADYCVITIGQGSGHFLASNNVYDELMGFKKSPERDLVADLADALNPLGIKVLVYTASELGWGDLETRKALGMTSHHNDHRLGLRDKDVPNDPKENRKGQVDYLKNWEKIHEQWSKQWGKHVAGWWVDGCYHKDIRFPEDEPPNFKTMKEALLAGNPDAIVSFNGGKGIYVYSKHEDYTPGEIARQLPDCPGPWVEEEGHRSRFHILTYLGEKWGRGNPRYSDDEVAEFAIGITSKGGFVSFDVPPQKNGLISEAFIPQLKHIGESVDHHADGARNRGDSKNATD
jgi:alpha-L-fucosidase